MLGAKYHLNRVFKPEPLHFPKNDLIQIGRLYCNENTEIKPHLHLKWFELTIATDGKGEVITNDVPVPVERGDIYLSYPCELHAIRSFAQTPLKYDFFAFYPTDAGLAEEMETIIQQNPAAIQRIFWDERIGYLVGNALAEVDSDKDYSADVLGAIFEQVMIYIIRAFKGRPADSGYGNVSHAEMLCYQMMHYIDTHINTMRNLEELADVFRYHYCYLSALFKKTTSNTLFQYYHNRKLETARLLVLENRLMISEIANTLNYSSVYAFTKAFHARYGMSPTAYFRIHGESEDKLKHFD